MKRINQVLLFGCIMFSGLLANAQRFSIGARGGVSIPNLTAGGSDQNPINTGYSSRLGGDAGIFGEYKVSSLFSLELLAEYSSQGGKKNGYQALPVPAELAPFFPSGQAPTYLYATFNSQAKLNYLLVPLLAKFGWNFKQSPWRIYVDAGPFVGFLLSAKQVTTGSSMVYLDAGGQQPIAQAGTINFNNTQDIKSQLNTTNFGIEGNVGLNYQFGMSNIFFEVGGNYGFLNIQKGSANGKNNTGAATAAVGYRFSFGK